MTISYAVALTGLVAVLADTGPPSTCALYFDFTHTQESLTWFGDAQKDGTLKSRGANLGSRNDPQGQLTISTDGSSFSFLTHDNSTSTKKFGCCDPVTILNVEMSTGKWAVQSLHRTSAVKGANCGIYGCGFLDIAGVNPHTKKVTGWVEQLLPQPPPAPSPKPQAPPAPSPKRATRRSNPLPKDRIGQAFVEFDLASGDATQIRPFAIDASGGPNQTVGFAGPSARFDDEDNMWFQCYPDNKDQDTEGMCKASATPAKTNAKVSSAKWSNKKFYATDIQYSKALKSVIVFAQEINGGSDTSMTNIYQYDAKSMDQKTGLDRPEDRHRNQDWPLLLSLGKAWGTLHQTTISSDGRYLMVLLGTGDDPDFPVQNMVTIDLVAKKEVGRVVVKDNANIAILQVLPCQGSSPASEYLV